MSCGDEDIFVAIEIDIQEDRRPRPLRGLDPAQMRNLRIRPVAAIQLEHVPFEMCALKCARARLEEGVHELALGNTSTAIPAEHVHYQEIVIPVAIDIREINAHRKRARAAQNQWRQGLEMS